MKITNSSQGEMNINKTNMYGKVITVLNYLTSSPPTCGIQNDDKAFRSKLRIPFLLRIMLSEI